MNVDELIARINFLYKKSQEEGLSEEEKKEQELLRRKYIDNVKNNFRAQMVGIERKPTKKKYN